MNLNKFIDLLFKDYQSLSPENFQKRCKELNKDSKEVLKYLEGKGLVKILKNSGHVQFVKYL